MRSHSQKSSAKKPHAARSVVLILAAMIAAAGLFDWFMLNQSGGNQKAPLGRGVSYQEIPGLDLSTLPQEARAPVLLRLNREECPCGCNMTVAHCRHVDPKCQTSLEAFQRISRTLAASRDGAAGQGRI